MATRIANNVVHVLGLTKPNGERYVIMFPLASRFEAIRQLARWAQNEDLSFTWFDAANLSERIRKL